jgi:hypothetical protein
MIHEKMSEFVIMLLLERLSMDNRDFDDYFKSNYNLDKFNNRYRILLDEFLNPYALNKTEKSE